MRPATHDSDVIVMNDGVRIGIRSSHSGLLPEKITQEMEVAVAESLHVFLQQASYRWGNCKDADHQKTLTEMLENSMEMIKEEFPGIVRYTHVTTRPEQGMIWVMEVFLEGACAPTVTKIEFHELKGNK